MKLRIILGTVFTALFIGIFSTAQTEDLRYQIVDPFQPTETGDKVEVLEFFWYGCPHCYHVEPYLEEWQANMPEGAEFRRIPGVLSGRWIPHARAFYTAEKLGILEQIHRPLFDAIHKENERISSQDHLADFFAEHGVDKDEFNRIYESEEVTDAIKQAYLSAKNYSIGGVPTIIVNGKYRTSISLAGGERELIATINDLIEKERTSN